MKLYSKMAAQNLRSNARFYLPRIGAEAGLIACFYIMLTLALDDRMQRVKGGSYIPTFMWMGAAILALLSAVLMLGLVSLAAGYAIALTTKSPLEALEFFFLAVLLVIVGTYFLFVAGSIFVLKALKNNDKFYYQPQNMPAVWGCISAQRQPPF